MRSVKAIGALKDSFANTIERCLRILSRLISGEASFHADLRLETDSELVVGLQQDGNFAPALKSVLGVQSTP